MDTEPQLIIRGEKIGLGPLRSDLVDTYLRWINDLRVNRTLALPSVPYTREFEENWLRHALVDSNTVIFTIYELDSLRPIGNTDLHNIDRDNNTAEFGIVIGEPDFWGRGYGTEATRLVVSYGFDVLGLHNIQLVVYGHNPAAIRAYERAGFRHIGVRRGARKVGRERVDVILMDIVADEVEPSGLHFLMQTGQAE